MSRKRHNRSPFNNQQNYDKAHYGQNFLNQSDYNAILNATQSFYSYAPRNIIGGHSVSDEILQRHLNEDWRHSGTAHLSCFVCGDNVRSTHSYNCPNKNNKDPDPSKCSCNRRERSFNERPICLRCYALNEQIAIQIYGECIRKGHLYREPACRDYSAILYTEIENNYVKDESKTQHFSKDKIHKSISMESMVTDMTDTSMTTESELSEHIDTYDDSLTTLIRGVDVVKKEHGFCFSCGYNQDSVRCIVVNNDNTITGNLKGLSHTQSQNYLCPVCNQMTLIKFKYWDIKSEFDYETNTIKIFHTLYDSSQLKFGHNESHVPLNDYWKDGKDGNDDLLDDYHRIINSHKNAIVYSCTSITKKMLQHKSKLKIESTQDIDVLHNLFFGNVDYYTLTENGISKYFDEKLITLPKKELRIPQVSPYTITKIDEIDEINEKEDFKKIRKHDFENEKTILEHPSENTMDF